MKRKWLLIGVAGALVLCLLAVGATLLINARKQPTMPASTPQETVTYPPLAWVRFEGDRTMTALMPDGSMAWLDTHAHFYEESDDTEPDSVRMLRSVDLQNVAAYSLRPAVVLMNNGEMMISEHEWADWNNVVKYKHNGGTIIALNADGTAVADPHPYTIHKWTDLVDVASNAECYIGLKSDGTILVETDNEELASTLKTWKNIKSVDMMGPIVIAVDQKGNVLTALDKARLLGWEERIANYELIQKGMEAWKGIDRIYCEQAFTVGLRTDGTLAILADEAYQGLIYDEYVRDNIAAASAWENVGDVALFCSDYDGSLSMMIARTKDGQLLMDGINSDFDGVQEFLTDWNNAWLEKAGIAAPAATEPVFDFFSPYRMPLAAGNNFAAIIHTDDNVRCIGEVYDDRGLRDEENWTDVVALAAGPNHLVGVKSDGTVLADGWDLNNQCDVDGWLGIRNVTAGSRFTVGLTRYGTVMFTGDSGYGQSSCRRWTNVIALSACDNHVVGLRADGTALATAAIYGYGCEDVLSWTHLIDVAAGESFIAAGLLMDGTVVTSGFSIDEEDGFTDLVDIVFGGDVLFGLRSDGTVVSNSSKMTECTADWKDVTAISGFNGGIIALKSDGTVLTAKAYGSLVEDKEELAAWNRNDPISRDEEEYYFYTNEEYFPTDALGLNEEWISPVSGGDGFAAGVSLENGLLVAGRITVDEEAAALLAPQRVIAGDDTLVVMETNKTLYVYGDVSHGQQAISTITEAGFAGLDVGKDHIVGITTEGDAVAVGDNTYGQCDIDEWSFYSDIAAGDYHSVAVIGNGYVTKAVGDNTYGQCNVGNWYHVVKVAAGARHTLGLMSTGELRSTGDNTYGQCDVDAWDGKVVQIAAGERFSAGLTEDGSVLVAGELAGGADEALKWTNIVWIDAYGDTLVAVDSMGEAYWAGNQDKLADWSKISLKNVTVPEGMPVSDVKVQLERQWRYMDGNERSFIALMADGTVSYVGSDTYYDEWDEPVWYFTGLTTLNLTDRTDIAMVAAVEGGALLMQTGEVIAPATYAGTNAWRNIVQIAGDDRLLAGLTEEGKVLLSGDVLPEVAERVAQWENVISIDVSNGYVFGVYMDGTLLSSHEGFDSFEGAVSLKAISAYVSQQRVEMLGLRKQGTVVSSTSQAVKVNSVQAEKASYGYTYIRDANGTVTTDKATDGKYLAWPDVIQMTTFGTEAVMQDKYGQIRISDNSDTLDDLGHVMPPPGITLEEEVIPAGTAGIATVPGHRRVVSADDMAAVLLQDGRILMFGRDMTDKGTGIYAKIEEGSRLITEDGWDNVVSLYYDTWENMLVGLREDGTLAIPQMYREYKVYSTWTDIVYYDNGYGVKSDGTIVTSHTDWESWAEISQWTDVVSVDMMGGMVCALRSDGTVLTSGMNYKNTSNASKWREIVDIAMDENVLYGVTKDGRLLQSDGENFRWTDETDVCIDVEGCMSSVFVLLDDGTIKGCTTRGYMHSPGNWQNIVEFSDNGCLMLGLQENGQLVYSCDDAWNPYLFSVPECWTWGIDTVNINTMEGVPQ